MIKIGTAIAMPTSYTLPGMSAVRAALMRKHEEDRAYWFTWPDYDAFRNWALEKAGAWDPSQSLIAPAEMEAARAEKRLWEMALNSQPLLTQIGTPAPGTTQLPLDDAPHTHLPNWDLDPRGPRGTFWWKNRRSGHIELHQTNAGRAERDNAARLRRARMTHYRNRLTNKGHWHSNVGLNAIHAVTDTTANRRTGGPPPSRVPSLAEQIARGARLYAGWSTRAFQTRDRRVSTMRGHLNAYADTIPHGEVETTVFCLDGTRSRYAGRGRTRVVHPTSGKLVPGAWGASDTSNDNRDDYYAEHSSGNGKDIGAKIKSNQHEAETRRHGGTYVQANSYSTTSMELVGGQSIPDEYYYLRLGIPRDGEPLGVFPSGGSFPSSGAAEWTRAQQPVSAFPTPRVFDETKGSLLALVGAPSAAAVPGAPGAGAVSSTAAPVPWLDAPGTPYFHQDCYEHLDVAGAPGAPLHVPTTGADGTESMALSETTPGTYDTGHFLPLLRQPP